MPSRLPLAAAAGRLVAGATGPALSNCTGSDSAAEQFATASGAACASSSWSTSMGASKRSWAGAGMMLLTAPGASLAGGFCRAVGGASPGAAPWLLHTTRYDWAARQGRCGRQSEALAPLLRSAPAARGREVAAGREVADEVRIVLPPHKMHCGGWAAQQGLWRLGGRRALQPPAGQNSCEAGSQAATPAHKHCRSPLVCQSCVWNPETEGHLVLTRPARQAGQEGRRKGLQ